MVVPSPSFPGHQNFLSGVAPIGAADAWAVGGTFDRGQSRDEGLIEHWNGLRWQIVEIPDVATSGLLDVDASGSRDVWAVGRYLAEHWDGAEWTSVPVPPLAGEPVLESVSVVPGTDHAWAVGHVIDPKASSLIERWDGTTWSRVASPAPPGDDHLVAVDAVSESEAWAVGYSYKGGNIYHLLLERWDGSDWTIVHAPPTRGAGSDVVALSSTEAWVVVGHSILRWDGVRWQSVTHPAPHTLGHITATSADDIWAAGIFIGLGIVHMFSEHWDGTTWSVKQIPSVGPGDNFVDAISAIPGTAQVWAVGEYRATNDKHPKTLTEISCP